MNRATILSAIVLTLLACSTAASDVSVRTLNKRIVAVGRQRALAELVSNDRKWSEFQSHIAHGEEPFMRAALRLYPVADGHVAGDLQHAFGEALKVAPSSVLTLAVPTMSVRQVCGPPDVDEVRFDSQEKATGELHLRRDAVLKLQRAEHQQACLGALADAEKQVERFYRK